MAATADRVPCVFVENQRIVGLDPADPIEVSYTTPFPGVPTGKEHPELLYNLQPSQGHDMAIVNGISRIGYMKGGTSALWKDEEIASDITSKAIAFIDNHKNQPFFLYFGTNDIHELKTPVSTISLAAQMLKDTDIVKNTEVFKHLSTVINDETKRLGFLVEKVLQMSLFERQKTAFKLKEFDANSLLSNVCSTFELKVQKYGGTIGTDLKAKDASIYADEMHITNVFFNLLDNAVKYRRPEVPLKLMARTCVRQHCRRHHRHL